MQISMSSDFKIVEFENKPQMKYIYINIYVYEKSQTNLSSGPLEYPEFVVDTGNNRTKRIGNKSNLLVSQVSF